MGVASRSPPEAFRPGYQLPNLRSPVWRVSRERDGLGQAVPFLLSGFCRVAQESLPQRLAVPLHYRRLPLFHECILAGGQPDALLRRL